MRARCTIVRSEGPKGGGLDAFLAIHLLQADDALGQTQEGMDDLRLVGFSVVFLALQHGILRLQDGRTAGQRDILK